VRRAEEERRAAPEPGLVSTLINAVVFAQVVHLHRHKPRDHDPMAHANSEAPYKVPARPGGRDSEAQKGGGGARLVGGGVG
jgi:hypothetical protein